MATPSSRHITLARGLAVFRDTLKFQGRATRTDVVSFWLIYMFAMLVVTSSALTLSSFELDLPEWITAYLIALFSAGTPGPNRYGPDPRLSAGQ